MLLREIKNFLLLVLVFFVVKGCTISKSRYFSYNVKTYSIDSGKKLVSVAKLISYGDYLFESIMQMNLSDTIYGGSDEENRKVIYISNGGVYLLKIKSDLYFELDSFSENAKLIKQGKNSEKLFGVKFSAYDTSLSSKPLFYKTLPIDTTINNVECYYIDINLAVNNVDSSYEQKIFLYKNKLFNSFYKLWNANYLDSNYSIIGVYFLDKNQNNGFVEEPDSLRVLTKMEEKICKAMIKKAAF